MDWVPTDSAPKQGTDASPLLTDPTLALAYVEGICCGCENGMRDCMERIRALADLLEAELAETIRLAS